MKDLLKVVSATIFLTVLPEGWVKAQESQELHTSVVEARESIRKVQEQIEKPILELDEFYRKNLEELKAKYLKAGNLEAVLAIRAEIDFVGSHTVNNQGKNDLEDLASLRKKYSEEMTRRSAGLVAKQKRAFEEYGKELEELKKKLTQEGTIDGALAIADEQDFVRKMISAQNFLPVDQWQAERKRMASIPDDATEWEGHFYKVFDHGAPVAWTDARTACEKMGGHLATITSRGEQEVVARLREGRIFLWTGGISSEDGKDWEWLDGTPLTYKNWRDNRPDNQGEKSFITINRWDQWDDAPNIYPPVSAYVCEWE